MLRSMKDLENYAISASDGQIGHVKDFYFDDDAWVVRYLVVEAGSWLSRRKVLVSPIAVHHPNWSGRTLPVSMTREQVKSCPDIDTDKPVSRQHEEDYLQYYGYPFYWNGTGPWGNGLYPYELVPGYLGGADPAERERDEEAQLSVERERHRNDDPHLRSCKAVVGHRIHATDGEIGHVSGYLFDDETWTVRYLVVDTSNWWIGHKVLVAPLWITGVHWNDRTVSVDLTQAAIRDAPPYDPKVEWTREQELRLFRHYGHAGHWADTVVPIEMAA